MGQLLITNPHMGLKTEGGWAMGFRWGFLGPAFSSDPPLVIAAEQFDAFNDGVLAGQTAAIEGIAIDPACVPPPPDSASHDVMKIFHIGEFGAAALSAAYKHFAHGAIELFVLAFALMIPSGAPFDPVVEFDRKAEEMSESLRELGLADRELFLGAGISESDHERRVLLTPIFRSLDGAREAVDRLGRLQFLISRWDAGAPMSGGGFKLIDTNLP